MFGAFFFRFLSSYYEIGSLPFDARYVCVGIWGV